MPRCGSRPPRPAASSSGCGPRSATNRCRASSSKPGRSSSAPASTGDLHQDLTVDQTTKVQAMAEDLTNPIGQSTGWKEVTLDCTGAGGGGLSGAPGNSNPDACRRQIRDCRDLFRHRRRHQGRTDAAPDHAANAAAFRPDQDGADTEPQAVAAKDRFYRSKIGVN